MKFICGVLTMLTALAAGAAELEIYRPRILLTGKRINNVPRWAQPETPGGRPRLLELKKVPETRFRFVFAMRNRSGNILKIATGFTDTKLIEQSKTGMFVLRLSHARLTVNMNTVNPAERTGEFQPFELVFPLEDFRIVTLRPGDGVLINCDVWVPDGKVRPGDKLLVEYFPRNHNRYDFWQGRLISAPVIFQPDAVPAQPPVLASNH